MKDLNKNRKGYKHSPVGWIPEDWMTFKIKDFAETTAGGTPSTSMAEYWGGDIKWMSSGDLNMKWVYEVEGRITELGLKKSSTRLIPPRSILIGLAGQGKTRGTVAMNMIELCTNQSVAAVLPNDSFLPEYLYYNLDYRYQELRRLSTGDGGRGGLNLGIIDSIIIPFPSLQEQDLIVKTISLWDNLISDTEKLVSYKVQLKKGLIQQLLTGKKRLPGYNGEWKELHLGELFSERNEFGHNDLPLLSITADRGVIYQSETENKDNSNEDKSKYRRICPGDIGYNTMRMWQGRSALSTLEGIVSPAYTIVTPNDNAYVSYFAYLFKLSSVINLFYRNSQGLVSDTLNCKYHDFARIRITIPGKEEQIAIANILCTTDQEINLLKSQLELYRQQKKGLMQILLTGAVRVKV